MSDHSEVIAFTRPTRIPWNKFGMLKRSYLFNSMRTMQQYFKRLWLKIFVDRHIER